LNPEMLVSTKKTILRMESDYSSHLLIANKDNNRGLRIAI
jgi:hypothetical protein